MKYWVTLDGREREVDVDLPLREVKIAGQLIEADVETVPGGVNLRLGGRVYDIAVGSSASRAQVAAGPLRAELEVEGERARSRRARRTDSGVSRNELRAPMPGRVVRVLVQIGAAVEAGDPLIVVEAMKMENELRAEGPGTVKSVEVVEGASVEVNELLVSFEEPSE